MILQSIRSKRFCAITWAVQSTTVLSNPTHLQGEHKRNWDISEVYFVRFDDFPVKGGAGAIIHTLILTWLAIPIPSPHLIHIFLRHIKLRRRHRGGGWLQVVPLDLAKSIRLIYCPSNATTDYCKTQSEVILYLICFKFLTVI